MSIDLSRVTGISDSRGVITEIKDSLGRVIWAVSGGKAVLMVEKITSDTYAGETTYTGEQFILLNVYPKTNGTVKVTYGGLTKTITDTSGVAEPNAQQVFFGTFNGVSDSVATPASGKLTIDGDYYAFGTGLYKPEKAANNNCACITKVRAWGQAEVIPREAFEVFSYEGPGLTGHLVISSTIKGIEDYAFSFSKISGVTIASSVRYIGDSAFANSSISGDLIIPSSVETIGDSAFSACAKLTNVTIGEGVSLIGSSAFLRTTPISANGFQKVTILSRTPPTLTMKNGKDESGNPVSYYNTFGLVGDDRFFLPERIIVPQGCGDVYKSAAGWSVYASLITEES